MKSIFKNSLNITIGSYINIDGPGPGMEMANDYLMNVWMPKNKDSVYNYGFKEGNCTHHFEVKKSEKPYRIVNIGTDGLESSFNINYWIEVYKTNIQEEPESASIFR